MKLIECENLTLCYDRKEVVRELSFFVEQGSYLCIVGENGSGKSTLLNCLLGLHKPQEGSVTYGKGFSRNQIGYLPQKTPIQQDFPATVEEIVRSGLLGRKKKGFFFSKTDKQVAEQMIEEMDLGGLRKASFRELSGGQQQRVLLARALTSAETMLILDEPVTGLDPLATAELYQTVKEKNRQGLTVIMVSHDIETALHNADTVLHLTDGEHFFGTKGEYIKSALFRRMIGGGV